MIPKVLIEKKKTKMKQIYIFMQSNYIRMLYNGLKQTVSPEQKPFSYVVYSIKYLTLLYAIVKKYLHNLVVKQYNLYTQNEQRKKIPVSLENPLLQILIQLSLFVSLLLIVVHGFFSQTYSYYEQIQDNTREVQNKTFYNLFSNYMCHKLMW